MAKDGEILLTDLFKEHGKDEYNRKKHPLTEPYGAMYSIFTAKAGAPIACNNNKVIQKAVYINQFFNWRRSCKDDEVALLPKNDYSCLASTREKIHQELLEVFGGASDSEGEEYSSDEDYEVMVMEEVQQIQ